MNDTTVINNLYDRLDISNKSGISHRRIGYITIPDEFTVVDSEYIQGHIMHQDFVIAPYTNMRVVHKSHSPYACCLDEMPTPENLLQAFVSAIRFEVYSTRRDTLYKTFLITVGLRLEGWDWRVECVTMVNKEDVK